ncbi:hypothetical protein RB195_022198 [Necator americanus]|uniref:GIY-YIG domain-containing protein n=1 Tax=Necator americanus TaxID=51031 RepID=A0ABR1EEL9_NECAM
MPSCPKNVLHASFGLPVVELECSDDVVILASSSAKLQCDDEVVSKLAAAYGSRLCLRKCKQFKVRVSSSVFNSLTKCLWSTTIANKVRLRLALTAIRPIMIYRSETWAVPSTVTKKLDRSERTAVRVTSDIQGRIDAINLAQRIANSNGYTGNVARRPDLGAQREYATVVESNKINFCLPFITEDLSKAISASLVRSGFDDQVRVVEMLPTNLKKQLVRNRMYDRFCLTPDYVICPFGKEEDCMVSGVVYLISCKTCRDQYIGETGRPLCVRIEEHLKGMKQSNVVTSLGAHRRQCHENVPFCIAVTILSYEPEIIARRTLEAFWINAKGPKMNRKEECLAVTNELALYQDPCGFDLRGHLRVAS